MKRRNFIQSIFAGAVACVAVKLGALQPAKACPEDRQFTPLSAWNPKGFSIETAMYFLGEDGLVRLSGNYIEEDKWGPSKAVTFLDEERLEAIQVDLSASAPYWDFSLERIGGEIFLRSKSGQDIRPFAPRYDSEEYCEFRKKVRASRLAHSALAERSNWELLIL